jgi:uncharacterized protein (DUF2235 family)
MGKRIVICSDGTGQSDDGINPSNVARLCSLLDLTDRAQQICCYDPGVGTVPGPKVSALTESADRCSTSRGPGGPVRAPRLAAMTAGLAVGYGLKQNVEQLYGYLAEHFEKGDSIYLFGFSRGAFTVRVVAGLVNRFGLLLPGHLDRFEEAFGLYEPHYESYRDRPGELAELKRRIADFKTTHARTDECRVHFLGIWDTVKSYGYLKPKSLPHTRHNPIVDTVRHALSIDERRSFFALTTWGGRDQDVEDKCVPLGEEPLSGDVEEVWFAGDHSDVGGGHEEAVGLAMISLKWMVNEAFSRELKVDEGKYGDMLTHLDRYDYRRHDAAAKLLWRVSERVPRGNLMNCPLPPTRHWTAKPSGQRSVSDSRRKGDILIHESAQRFYGDGERQPPWAGYPITFRPTAERIGGAPTARLPGSRRS